MHGWQFNRESRLFVAIAGAAGIPVLNADTLLPMSVPRLYVREADGECECGREAILARIGELFGADAEHKVRAYANPSNN
jgi:hypothetical protein